MTSWHQLKAGLPTLYHPTMWTAYNPAGHLSVMRFSSSEACIKYCNKTGDTPLPPYKEKHMIKDTETIEAIQRARETAIIGYNDDTIVFVAF